MGDLKKRNKCIILDLDECLLHTIFGQNNMYIELMNNKKYSQLRVLLYNVKIESIEKDNSYLKVESYHLWGIKRPHLHLFLTYLMDNFEYVCIWSAGKKHYVEAIVRDIFTGIGTPHLIFTYDDIHSYDNGQYCKPLDFILQHSVLKNKITNKDVWFMDDKEDNFVTHPGNGIVIPKYKPSLVDGTILDDDICLLQVMNFIEHNITNPDYSTIDKSKIFNTGVDVNSLYNKYKNNFIVACYRPTFTIYH